MFETDDHDFWMRWDPSIYTIIVGAVLAGAVLAIIAIFIIFATWPT